MSTENPTEDTSSSTSYPSALSTTLTTQRIDDHTLHQTTTTVQRKITDKTANILTTTRPTGKSYDSTMYMRI